MSTTFDDGVATEVADDKRKETVVSVDDKGIKTLVKYVKDDQGREMKVTRRVRTVKRFVKVNKFVEARKQWKKFGDCAGKPSGPEENITYESFETVEMDMRPKKRDEVEEESGLDRLQKEKKDSANAIVVCRHCGETGHWTLKCPKRNSIAVSGESGPSRMGGGSDAPGKYVPVHKRAGAKGSRQTSDHELTVRVTNLSEDATENDLRELFRPFGHTTRIFLAKDRQTGKSRGFGFITYETKSEAERAIEVLDGHPFDSLILHVEWSKPQVQNDGERTKAVLAKMRRQF